jgi:hypothetical protein
MSFRLASHPRLRCRGHRPLAVRRLGRYVWPAVVLIGQDLAKRFGELIEPFLADGIGPPLSDASRGGRAKLEVPPGALGVSDAARSPIDGVGFKGDVPESLEITQQVVGRLLAHPVALGDVGGAQPVHGRELLEGAMHRTQIVEPFRREARVDVFLHVLPGHAQHRTNLRPHSTDYLVSHD